MKLFKKKNDITIIEEKATFTDDYTLNTDIEKIHFLKDYVHRLDSLFMQECITQKQYQSELTLIGNEVAQLEREILNEINTNN